MPSRLQMALYEQIQRIINCLKQNIQNREEKQHQEYNYTAYKTHEDQVTLFTQSLLTPTATFNPVIIYSIVAMFGINQGGLNKYKYWNLFSM